VSKSRRLDLTALGGVVGAGVVSAVYAASGYHTFLPYLLLASVAVVFFSFHRRPPNGEPIHFSRADLIAIALLLFLVPVYSWRVYTVPWQVNTDEITLMSVARNLLAQQSPDFFGLSGYFGCPAAAFLFFGKVSQLMGGVDLYHVRLMDSLLGVGCILAAYALFRRFLSPVRAASLAAILGANHSLVAYSRMGMWPNSALLLELLALFFVTRGLQRKSRGSMYLAGVMAGLAFYSYFPGRIIFAICLSVLGGVWLVQRNRESFVSSATSAAILMLGWAMVTAPVLIATAKNRTQGLEYQRQQFIIYPEGQQLAEYWTDTHTVRDAWIANARLGLGTFNAGVVDHGWLYNNLGHGFVDPVTGILLWIGFIGVVVRFVRHMRRRRGESTEDEATWVWLGDLIALIGFLSLYLSLAFLITKAPNYQRLLIILPFVAYLAGTGLWWIVDGAVRLAVHGSRAWLRNALAGVSVGLTVAAIVLMNASIFSDFHIAGRKFGHDVGSTGRFVEARKGETGHKWILAADKKYLYYWWGEPWWWQGWLGFFAGPNQSVQVIAPHDLVAANISGKFTVFLSQAVWADYGKAFSDRYEVGTISRIMPDANLVAIEATGAK